MAGVFAKKCCHVITVRKSTNSLFTYITSKGFFPLQQKQKFVIEAYGFGAQKLISASDHSISSSLFFAEARKRGTNLMAATPEKVEADE